MQKPVQLDEAITSDEDTGRTHGSVYDGSAEALFIDHGVSVRQGIADAESEVEGSVAGGIAATSSYDGPELGQRNAVQVFEHEDHGVVMQKYLDGSERCRGGSARRWTSLPE